LTELQVIKGKIRERMNQIADDLAVGVALDYNQYKYLVGMIAGLAMVERDIVDLEEIQRSAE